MNLPTKIHEVSGSHKVAIDRTVDIHLYVDRAVDSLTKAYSSDERPFVRGGLVRDADDLLDTIIRFAKCAKDELRRAYCRNGE